MAIFTAFSSFDYKRISAPDVNGVALSSTQISWNDSFLNWTVSGTGLTISPTGISSGTASSIVANISDMNYFTVTGGALNLASNYNDNGFRTSEGIMYYGDTASHAAMLMGKDIVKGSAYADRLGGFDGNDEIYGFAGSDWLDGGAGDDFIAGGLGNDTINGGAGWDMVDYGSATGAMVVSLVLNQSTGADGTDKLSGIEEVRGSNFADRITGDGNDNWFIGLRGNDTIDGGSGWDAADYKYASAAVTVNLSLTLNQATGADGTDQLTNIEVVRGSNFADRLTGNASDNGFRGLLGNDTIDGGAGWDYADYRDATAAVAVNLATGSTTGGGGNDRLIGIEEVRGSSFNDTLTGDGNDNWLRGDLGNDTINGGAGWDFADYRSASGAVTVNLSLASNQVTGAAGTDQLISIEQVRGTDFNDKFTGDRNDNWFRGVLGNDTIDGGAGWDFADYKNAYGAVTVNLSLATNQATGADGTDQLKNIEAVRGSNFADILTGNASDNGFRGLLGNDTIDGGAGWDYADYKNATAAVTVNLSLASNQVTGADGIDQLIRIEEVRGSDFNDTLTGNSGDNWFRGNLGNDSIDGGAGKDLADYSNATSAVTVNLSLTTNQATGGGGIDQLKNVEFVRGSDFADRLTGNNLANALNGGLGKDVLTGGAGTDMFIFRNAYGSNNIDTVTDFLSGTDKIALDDDVFTQLGTIGTSTGVAMTATKFQLGSAANDVNDRIIYNQSSGALYYDADGSGTGFAQVQIALIGTTTHQTVAATDFLILA